VQRKERTNSLLVRLKDKNVVNQALEYNAEYNIFRADSRGLGIPQMISNENSAFARLSMSGDLMPKSYIYL
jgi:hypothetical protein